MIVLINTPLKLNEYSFTSIQYPINLGYLASVLQKNNFSVQIWDYGVEKFTEEKFAKRLKDVNPKIIGFSCITPNIINGGKLASLAKSVSGKILTIVGGPHITALPEKTLKEFPDFDIGVIGEGEETLVELLQTLDYKLQTNKIDNLNLQSSISNLQSVKGIIYRKGKDIIQTQIRPVVDNIDTLPFPARYLVDINLYKNTHPTKIIRRTQKNISEIITSRGCPYKCFFCAGHGVFQHKTRLRSIDNILQEVDECIKKYNTGHLTILDNTFTLEKERTTSLCREFKKRNLTFDCNSRIDTVDEELLYEMKDGGCIKISFGIESGTDRILKLIDKKTSAEKIKKTITQAKKAGIEILEGTAIIGSHPTETKEEVKQTIKLLKELPLDYVVVDIIVPYPGSPVWEYMKEKELILSEDWSKYTPYGEIPQWRTENFSPKDLVVMQKKAMFSFYFRPRQVLKKIKKIKNIQDLIYYLRITFDFLFKG